MKAIALIAALATITCFATPEQDIVNAISASRMMDNIKYLSGATSSIKTRYTPASGCFVAANWTKAYFESLGYMVTLQSWGTVDGYPAAPNVIARKPGTNGTNEVYVLCAHLDSVSNQPWTNAPGADDNASGSAIVMEAALLLKDYPTEYTVEFVLFTGEEQWMLGSSYYVQNPGSRQFLGAINCDMTAYEKAPGTPIVVAQCNYIYPLADLVAQLSQYYNPGRAVARHEQCPSDQWAFGYAGIPNCMVAEATAEQIWGGSNPNYHKTTDTWDYLHPQFQRECAIAAIAGIAHLANVSNGMAAVLMPEYVGNRSAITVEVQLREPGQTQPIGVFNLPLSAAGTFELPDDIPAGTWDISVRAPGWLRGLAESVSVPSLQGITVLLKPGDANNDNRVDVLDLNAVLLAFGAAGAAHTDIDGDGVVALGDLNLVLLGFGKQGDP